MEYEIVLEYRFLFLTFKRIIKQVIQHLFPNDFQNDGILMIVKKDGSRELINIKNYSNVQFPAICFLGQNQIQNQQPLMENIDKREPTLGDVNLLKEL